MVTGVDRLPCGDGAIAHEVLQHGHHGGTGKAVQRGAEQHEVLAMGDLLVHHLGDVGTGGTNGVTAGLDVEAGLRQLFLELCHEPLGLSTQSRRIKGLIRLAEGNTHAGTQVHKLQGAESLPHGNRQPEHIPIIALQSLSAELLALQVGMEANDADVRQLLPSLHRIIDELLVNAELGSNTGIGGIGEVRVDPQADLRHNALLRSSLLNALHLCGTVSHQRGDAQAAPDVRHGLTGGGENHHVLAQTGLLAHNALSQAGGVHAEALIQYAAQDLRIGVAFHGIQESHTGEIRLQLFRILPDDSLLIKIKAVMLLGLL